MNRREVVEGLLLGAAFGAATTAVAGSPGRECRIVIFDSRFAQARRFGREAGTDAWLTQGTTGDVTPLWNELLTRGWQRHATSLHGMTAPPAFHCLEQLVAECFWRVSATTVQPSLIRWVMMPTRAFS